MRRRTGPDHAVVRVVRERDLDRCRRCGGPGQQIHHRRPRGMGGTRDQRINSPSNLVLLCQSCHMWVETHRADAYAAGWLVRTGLDPASTPIIHDTTTVWLADDGHIYPRKDHTHA